MLIDDLTDDLIDADLNLDCIKNLKFKAFENRLDHFWSMGSSFAKFCATIALKSFVCHRGHLTEEDSHDWVHLLTSLHHRGAIQFACKMQIK